MIPHAQNNEVHRSGIAAGSEFRFVMNAHMASLMSDKMYKDKVSAVIRELSCNAHDSHLEAGNPDPIKIHLPTALEPWFSVTDQGLGLDDQEVTDLFTTYGASSKRGTNKLVGQFGIGSKVGFAYTDQFTVEAVKDGVKRTYSCYKDEDGMPRITPLLTPSKVQDRNGVKIEVPARPEDIGEFGRKAARQLAFFNPRPSVNSKLVWEFPATDVIQTGEDWAVYKNSPSGAYNYNTYHSSYGQANILVVMGNVGYEVSTDQLPEGLLSWVQSGKLVVRVPIGSVDVSASREELSYNKVTVKALTNRLNKIKGECLAGVTAEFKSKPNLWEQRLLYVKLVTEHPLKTLIRAEYAKTLGLINSDPGEPPVFLEIDTYTLNDLKRKIHFDYRHQIHLSNLYHAQDIVAVLVSEEDGIKNMTTDLKVLYHKLGYNNSGTTRILLVKGRDEAHLIKLAALLGDPTCASFHRLRDVTDVDREAWAKATDTTWNAKTQTVTARKAPAQCLVYGWKRQPSYRLTQKDEKEQWGRATRAAIQETEGFYFRLKDYRVDHPVLSKTPVQDVLGAMVELGLINDKTLVVGTFSAFKNPFQDETGWVNLAHVWDGWCRKNIVTRSSIQRTVNKLCSHPQLNDNFIQLEVLNNSYYTNNLISLVEDDILKIEKDENLRKYYHHLYQYKKTQPTKWVIIVQRATGWPMCGNFWYRYQEAKKNWMVKTKEFATVNHKVFEEKYPLLPIILKTNYGDDVRNHIKLYMEKCNG